jgi:hypothetical protein
VPSVPSPDSANTTVCVALAATVELDPPELQAAAPAASATAPMLIVTARQRGALFLLIAIPPHYGE